MKSKTKARAKPCYNDQVESYNREKQHDYKQVDT